MIVYLRERLSSIINLEVELLVTAGNPKKLAKSIAKENHAITQFMKSIHDRMHEGSTPIFSKKKL